MRGAIGDLLRQAGTASADQDDWAGVAIPTARTEPMLALGRRRRRRRAVLRALAGVGLVLTGLVVLALLRPPPPPPAGVPTLVMAHAVPAGTVLRAEDLAVVVRPAADRPDGALSELARAVGATSAGPIGMGEVLTPIRLLGPALLTGTAAGTRAMSVPVLAGPGLGLAAGHRVDLFRSDTGTPVAQDVLVLAVPQRGTQTGSRPAPGDLASDAAQAGADSTLSMGSVGAVGGSLAAGTGTDPAAVVVAVTSSQAESLAAGLGGGGDRGFHVALRATG